MKIPKIRKQGKEITSTKSWKEEISFIWKEFYQTKQPNQFLIRKVKDLLLANFIIISVRKSFFLYF
jgi:hypothetical protein